MNMLLIVTRFSILFASLIAYCLRNYLQVYYYLVRGLVTLKHLMSAKKELKQKIPYFIVFLMVLPPGAWS